MATQKIKDDISAIADSLRRQGRAGCGTKDDYKDWLILVEDLWRTYGYDYVPIDIRKAYNSVQVGVGGIPVEFPGIAKRTNT